MAYLGIAPFEQTVRTVSTFTATASQTTFSPTGGYVLGYVDVYLNGIKLVAGDDFTATNALTVVLALGASAGDVLETVAYFPTSLVGSGGGGGATGGSGNEIFYENEKTVTVNYTITSGKNAMSAGPITIADGVVVTVPDGSTWTIV
jgi:hypothetical protein